MPSWTPSCWRFKGWREVSTGRENNGKQTWQRLNQWCFRWMHERERQCCSLQHNFNNILIEKTGNILMNNLLPALNKNTELLQFQLSLQAKLLLLAAVCWRGLGLNTKRPISLACVLKPQITEITVSTRVSGMLASSRLSWTFSGSRDTGYNILFQLASPTKGVLMCNVNKPTSVTIYRRI